VVGVSDRMQPLDVLLAAGPGVILVARPRGVAHLYAGPLTSSGAVVHSHRPACGAHPGRLRDLLSQPVPGELRVCLSCAARVSAALPAVRAEHHAPVVVSMADDRRAYTGLTVVDIYLSVRFAVTEAELDECSLALQLCFTPAEQSATYDSPTGRTFSDLPRLINRQRDRINPPSGVIAETKPKNDPAYWDAVTRFEQSRRKPPRHRRQNIRLRTA
jgi:hypothetical protein